MASIRWPARITIGAGVLALLALGLAAAAGFFDRDPEEIFDARDGGPRPLAAVLFSGDMGLRFGVGPYIAKALARHDVPVLGISSPGAFGTRRSRAAIDAIVAGAIHDAMARAGASRVIVAGQSFGADMVRVGLADLPPEQRAKVAAIVLVVPGQTAFFRADPSGLTYRGAPDAGPGPPDALDWAPVVCVRGVAEKDSLCPLLRGSRLRAITLPGGHFLHRDHALVVGTVMGALRPLLPEEAGRP